MSKRIAFATDKRSGRKSLFVPALLALTVLGGALVAAAFLVLGRPHVERGPSIADQPADVSGPAVEKATALAPVQPRASYPSTNQPSPLDAMADNVLLPLKAPVEAAKRNLERELKDLAQSGPPRGSWTSLVSNVLREWKGSSSISDRVELGEAHCFERGCSVEMTSRDAISGRLALNEMEHARQFMSWPGPKFCSGPFPSSSQSGRTVFIFFRPAAAQTN
jgi:hypothetical protein